MEVILVLFFVVLVHGSLADLLVELPNGKVNGTTIETPSGKTFYAWRGIPFARPPIGKLRYLAPQPADPWDGILDATEDSPACVFFRQFYEPTLGPVPKQSEDCLYINVYSPVTVDSFTNPASPLPVMFWIFGGAFTIGTGNFQFSDPTPFLEENVIVVTFNYRIGTFGFLSLEDDVLPGNAGLKDQLLALKWTRDNIAHFGGHPQNITIFGGSAGAASVGYHLLSPKSRNLFKGAIMQSGSALLGMYQTNARVRAFRLAKQIDPSIRNANTSEQVRDILQAADGELIRNLTNTASTKVAGPVIESESNEAFLTEPFYEQLKSGNIANVPVIIGYNSEESLYFNKDLDKLIEVAKQYDLNPEDLVSDIRMKHNVSSEEAGKAVHHLYVGENGQFSENLAAYLEWQSDIIFTRGCVRHALFQSKVSPVYMYQFSYVGSLSGKNIVIPGAGKVGHAQEVGYFFNISTNPLKLEKDYLIRRRLVKLWTNFAKYSNPTPDDDSKDLLQNVLWLPITKNNFQNLDISDNLRMLPNRKAVLIPFWENIWNTYSDRPYYTF